jgi:hypothetical protein
MTTLGIDVHKKEKKKKKNTCTGSSTAAATSFWGSPDLGMALVGFSSA